MTLVIVYALMTKICVNFIV